MMNSSSRNATSSLGLSSPFTATQWQELEHQALIFKYMVSGVPIPPDLLFSVKRSLDSSVSSRLFPRQPNPEPGRCRRTDGKKWRCSKEAYPDSKYCEKHMHRGRNRSRKPVESTPSPQTPSVILNSTRNISSSTPSLTSETQTQSFHQAAAAAATAAYHESSSINPFLYSHASSRLTCPDFTPNNTNSQLFLYSGSQPQTNKDFRNIDGPREGGVGEQAFFPSVADSGRSINEVYHQPLAMDSYKGCSQSISQVQGYNLKEQHCFVLGTDFNKSSRSVKTEEDEEEDDEEETETQKPLLHFFEDCPPKNSDSWLDLASNSNG